MRWLLVLVLALTPPAWATPGRETLEKTPGWALLTPIRIVWESAVLLRQARHLQSTAPLASLSRRLEELRGLKFSYPVRYTVMTPEGVRRFLDEQIELHYPSERQHRDERLLILLGMVAPDFKLRPFLLDLMQEQIAGAYDPIHDYFFVVVREQSWLNKALKSADEDAMITLHELDHALQNQRFDLKARQMDLAKLGNSDRELGFSGLIEGEATSVMYDLMLARQGTNSAESGMSMEAMGAMLSIVPLPGMGKFREAPLYFQRQLMFPYMVGCDFINALRRYGGWELVNECYARQPISSEQIYHPERYLADEQPLPLALKLSLAGWKELGQDSGGEFTLRVFLEQHGVRGFRQAAEGWGNDRMAIYEKDGQHCLVWLTRWDSAAEAEEFERAARAALGKAPGQWRLKGAGDRVLLARDLSAELWSRAVSLLLRDG
ncbi:hypothetical protein DYH09_02405 [bacterium CPR1]|nr:hypothetical protein [bacterium CPR1]